MIYDGKGNLYVTPRTIGFHQQVQSTTNEVAEQINFAIPDPEIPRWVEKQDGSFDEPYCKRKKP